MTKYLTAKNIGWALSALIALVLIGSSFGKLSGDQETANMLGSHNLSGWITIIGIGEIVSLLLFLIPKTMRLGALALSGYFGGAIMFHMAHPNPAANDFTVPAIFLLLIWATAWLRGMNIFDLSSPVKE